MTEQTEFYVIEKEEVAFNLKESGFKIEINPQKMLAFKTEAMQLEVFDEENNKTWVELADIRVLGASQILSPLDTDIVKNRLSILNFKQLRPVNFHTIGSSLGQGLEIFFTNPDNRKLKIKIKLRGRLGDTSKIGR